MNEFKFTYDSESQLRQLVDAISATSLKLSVEMRATAPQSFYDLIDSIFNVKHKHMRENYCMVRDMYKDKDFCSLLEKIAGESAINKIHPFSSLECGYGQPKMGVKIEHHFLWPEESPLLGIMHPSRFFDPAWRYFKVSLADAESRQDIATVKDTVLVTPKENYELTFVHVGLNPQDYVHDHYSSGTNYDATLRAYDGEVTIDFYNTGKNVQDASQSGIDNPSTLKDILEKIGMKGDFPKLTQGVKLITASS